MKSSLFFVVLIFLLLASPCQAGFFDDLIEKAPQLKELSSGSGTDSSSTGIASLLDNDTAVAGLKEALEVGIKKCGCRFCEIERFFE